MKNRSIRKILALGIVTTMLFGSLSFIPSVSASPEPAPTDPITLPDFIEIATDKRFYEVGELVNMSMTNNGNESMDFSISRVFSVTREWYTAGYVVAPFYGGYPSPITWTLNPGDVHSWDWNQHHYSWLNHQDTGIQVPTDIYSAWFGNGGDHDSALLTIVNPAIEVTTDKNEYLPNENVVITVTNIALPEFPYPVDVYCLFVDENGDMLWDDIINDVNLTVNESLQYTWNQINFDGQHVPIGNWTVMVKFMYSLAAYDDKYVNAASFLLNEEPPVLGEWQKINGPKGPYVSDIIFDKTNPQILYAALEGGGIYKSINGGDTWFEISAGISQLWAAVTVVLSPDNPLVLYAGGFDSGLYRTTNSGVTWECLTEGLDVQNTWSIVVDPTDTQKIYIGTRLGVWKTLDGGITWIQKNQGITWPRIYTMAMDPTDPDTLYAGNIFGDVNNLYKSTNGGDDWAIVNMGKDNHAQIWSIVIDSTNSSILYVSTDIGVFKSVDSGLNWTQENEGVTNHFTRDLVISPQNHETIYLTTWGGVFKSIDAGESWSLISSSFTTPFTRSIAMDPAGNTIFVGIFGGIYKSFNAGDIWELEKDGLYAGDAQISDKCFAIDPDNPDILYAGTFGGGVFKSTDRGRSWISINEGIDTAFCNGGIETASPTLYLGTDTGGIYKSTDGGLTWSQKINGLSGLSISHIELDPNNHDILYIGANKLYKSVDGAENWNALTTGIEGLNVKSIAIDPTNSQNIFIATKGWGAAFKSTDGGNTWVNISNGLPNMEEHIVIDPINPQILYAGSLYNGLFKTVDSGGSWFAINNGLIGVGDQIRVQSLVINPSNPRILYVGILGNGIFKSINGGESWVPLIAGLETQAINANALILDHTDPSIVYAATSRGIYKRYGDATVDIKPDTLNLKSKGKWITAYIELSGNYNVENIDINTILLNECVLAETHPTELGDYNNNGISDLMVKFDRSAVQAILQEGDIVKITVTGNLYDGTRFLASDTIFVICQL